MARNLLHKDGCRCAECWEPDPRSGETVDDACAREFRVELAQMPDKYVGMILEMAAAEMQKRHPSKVVVDSTLTGDREQIKELVKILSDALDKRLEQEPVVGFVDLFMALVNFDRLALESVERESGMTTLEQKKAFRSMFVATVHRSLMSRVMN